MACLSYLAIIQLCTELPTFSVGNCLVNLSWQRKAGQLRGMPLPVGCGIGCGWGSWRYVRSVAPRQPIHSILNFGAARHDGVKAGLFKSQ